MKKFSTKDIWIVCIIGIMFCWGSSGLVNTKAAIAKPDSFQDAQWDQVNESLVVVGTGWLQSMCVTDMYIVCFENEGEGGADTLIAYYKNDYDENGDPVPQYSYAMHMTERDYEHGNGMTYSPETNEIIIATGGKVLDKKNKGSLFVVDADTLAYKRTVKVTDENVTFTGLDYSKDTKQFVLQIYKKGIYDFWITDLDFNVIDTIPGPEKGTDDSFQDICVTGDYIMSMVYNHTTRVDNFVHVFSMSTKEYIGDYNINLEGYEPQREAESICETAPGVFITGTGVGPPRRIRFYETRVNPSFYVNTKVEGGTITESRTGIEGGTDYIVEYQPKEHYEIGKLSIDGEEVEELTGLETAYTFSEMQADHQIEIEFKEKPKLEITTTVKNGMITESQKIYRDDNYQVTYTPKEHYELERVLLDGKELDLAEFGTGYIFENIQEAHGLEVVYKEIPFFPVETKVWNGKITESIEKVYRDEDTKIVYEPKDQETLFAVLVDGEFVDKEQFDTTYTFENVQEGHSITVVYMWKYVPIVGGIIILIVLLTIIKIILTVKRRKRSIIKKRTR